MDNIWTSLILIVFLIFHLGNSSDCIVGFLDDTYDVTNTLAFINFTDKYNLKHSVRDLSNDHYRTLSATCSMLEDGVVALFGPRIKENSQIVRSVSYSKDIPHIETSWSDNQETSTFTVNLSPHPEVYSSILAELVRSKGWKSFALFFDDRSSLSRITGILKVVWESAIFIKRLDPKNVGNYRPVLKEAWQNGYTQFVIDCDIDRLPGVLSQAQQIGLMIGKNSYIITNLDMQTINLEPYKYSGTNITGLRMVNPDSDAAIMLADSINITQYAHLDGFHEPIRDILSNDIRLETALLIDGLHLLHLALESLPKNKDSCISSALCYNDVSYHQGATILGSLKMITFNGVTGYVKLDNFGHRRDFQLEIVELQESGLIKVGSWDEDNGITYLARSDEKSDSLESNNFTVITTLTAPYGMLKESEKPLTGNDRFEGFAIDIIRELSLIEKFNYTIIIRDDKANGDWNNVTEQWSGMIGDVLNGVAHLAIADLTITSERKEAVDFTTPFLNLGVSILYRKPTKALPNFFSFAAPFAVEVWIWIGGAYFVTSISLFIMGRLCPSEWTNPYPCVENPEYLINQFSMKNSFWFMLGSILQQGSEIAPIGYATRMTAGAWWFFTLIMVSTYTANLAAFLTTESSDRPFNDVYDLVKKADKLGIKYGAKAKGATEAFFRGSRNEEFQQVFKYFDAHPDVMVKENHDGVVRADEERYAFFMESVSIEYEVQRFCRLTQVGEMLDDKGYGIAMRKNATYRHRLNTALLKLQENGKIMELKRKWWEERRGGGQCGTERKTDVAPPLTLKHVGGVFWVTVGGTMVAVMLVFFEMFVYVLKKSIQHKKPFWIELREEFKFYLKCRGLVKPVRYRECSADESRSPTNGEESACNQAENQPQEEDVNYEFLPDIANLNS